MNKNINTIHEQIKPLVKPLTKTVFKQVISEMNNKVSIATVENSQLHLYLAWGCPFCHRIVAALSMTELEDNMSITWMENIKGGAGWSINAADEPLFNAESLKAVYQQLAPTKEYRHSVPLLVDKKNNSLLSTSSAEIVRYIATGFDNTFKVAYDLLPNGFSKGIDDMNQWLHDNINRAVYLVGFATHQPDYEDKLNNLFNALDTLEVMLRQQCFLLGDQLTESDLYLLATLERFDNVYFGLFKCSLKRIADYPALSRYHDQVRSLGALASTYQGELTKEHYFLSSMHVQGEVRDLNPSKIIPLNYHQ